jgi:hypothetical protein
MTDARRTSVAVMARRVEPADSLDFFPTPPWATRALCEHVLPAVWPYPDRFACSALDPACGAGHMALALEDYFRDVSAADIFDYGFASVADFLHPDTYPHGGDDLEVDWIITNPPFNLALEFIQKALTIAKRGVAMLVRMQFLEGEGRFDRLFIRRPPQIVAVFAERVPMHKGRWVINGKSATAYVWLVWRRHVPHDWAHQRVMWIPKSKPALSAPDDWLRFSGCMDLPKDHPALATAPAVEEEEAPRIEGSIFDVRRELQARLI